MTKCQLDNVTYVAGQKMTPKSDPCKVCLCKDGWKGQLGSKDFCYTMDCALGVKSLSEMKRGCLPIYRDGVCCPVDWACPIFDAPSQQVPAEDEAESQTRTLGAPNCPDGVAIRTGALVIPGSLVWQPEEPLGISELFEDKPRPGEPTTLKAHLHDMLLMNEAAVDRCIATEIEKFLILHSTLLPQFFPL